MRTFRSASTQVVKFLDSVFHKFDETVKRRNDAVGDQEMVKKIETVGESYVRTRRGQFLEAQDFREQCSTHPCDGDEHRATGQLDVIEPCCGS